MSEQHHLKLNILADAPPARHGVIIRRARIATVSILVLLAAGAALTVGVRTLHNRNLASATELNSRLYVSTVHAVADGQTGAITLPSTLQGNMEASIYARSNGYVMRWKKDIGSKIVKDEVLAEIDTPEIDAQLGQATAARAQQAASLELAKTSAERWEELRKQDAVTQQELNERRSSYTQASANLAAADAAVQRLQKMVSFKKVKAPFSGVIIRRDVEVGDLVNAGNGGADKALFVVANVHPIRLYVYVPQQLAQRIHIGDEVKVALTENPGQPLSAKVKHIAGAIDAATRTLQVEISLPNHDGNLLAGSYAQVTLSGTGDARVLRVASNVLLFRAQGTQIAVADAAGRVKLHTVVLGHDLGNVVEILSGINAEDNLIINPPDSLADGDLVVPQKPASAGKERP